MDVGLERVNFESHAFFFSDRHIFVKALHKLRPGVHECGLEAGPQSVLPIFSSFNPLLRGLDERGSHFQLGGKKNVIKQDARIHACAVTLPGNEQPR